MRHPLLSSRCNQRGAKEAGAAHLRVTCLDGREGARHAAQPVAALQQPRQLRVVGGAQLDQQPVAVSQRRAKLVQAPVRGGGRRSS